MVATGSHTTPAAGGQSIHEAKYGIVCGRKPTPRDGHSAVVDSNGYMYIFGGDRHHMPFNDLYMIKLPSSAEPE